MQITHFTDPGCPWAWSAEPFRRRLSWLYGDRLDWRVRLVGLAERPADYERRGFTPDTFDEGHGKLVQAFVKAYVRRLSSKGAALTSSKP